MSNPEKRDDRSMSDILASIRKIMAQEPAGSTPPGPTRTAMNGVSGAALDLPREPELKIPPAKKPAESPGSPAPSDAVSLDELLADAPRAAPSPTLAPKPAASGATAQPTGAPEWLFPKPNTSEAAKDKPAEPVLPVPTQVKDA